MKKRNLFAEISEGFEALKQEREGNHAAQERAVATPRSQETSIQSASPLEMTDNRT